MPNRFDFEDDHSGDAGSAVDFSHFQKFGQIDISAIAPALGTHNAAKGFLYETDLSKRLSFGEQLFFYTGSAFLSGVALGGTFGFFEGLRNARRLDTNIRRLRINAVLNAVSNRAPAFGNNLGVLALMYASTERGVEALRGKEDLLNPAAGGFITGMIFKSTAGLRSMLSWSVLGGVVMFGWGAFQQRDEIKENIIVSEIYRKFFPEKEEY